MKKSFLIALIITIVLIITGGYFLLSSQLNKSAPSEGQVPISDALSQKIDIDGFKFSPSSLTIKKGTTIKWTNKDNAPHTVTSDSGNELSSQTLSNGQSYSHTFSAQGIYEYYCTFHTSMKGKITVI